MILEGCLIWMRHIIQSSNNKILVLTCEKPGIRQHCFTQNAGVNDKSGVTSLIMVNAAGD